MAYSAGDLLVQSRMSAASGLPEDVCVNDFAFKFGAAPTDGEITDVFAHVDQFFNAAQTSGKSVSDYIGTSIDRAATHELVAYTIAAAGLGSPRFSANWLGPSTPDLITSNLPTEVAGCVSYHADLTGVLEEAGATRPKARRRGRLYIGPLTTDAVIINSTVPRMAATFLSTLRQAIIKMADDALADGATFCVWSRVDQVLRPVVGGWTDDAPDTQRRRGGPSLNRVTYSV